MLEICARMLRRRIRQLLKLFLLAYIFGLIYIVAKTHSITKVGQDIIEHGKLISKMTTLVDYRRHSENGTNCRQQKQGAEQIVKENNIIGPGEDGLSIKFPKNVNRTKVLSNYYNRKHGFNVYLSDLIGAHRSFGDCRPQACKDKTYPPDLPPASVVIIFRDEYPSMVLRTAYSVLDTTPAHMLREVIFVDDGSVDENLTLTISIHVANVQKFRFVRNDQPLGLMMARQRGIEAASADYFVVFDSHMEVCEGWLEPLIFRLLQEPNALLTPVVGGIQKDTFHLEMSENFDRSYMMLSQITMGQTWVSHSNDFMKMRNGSTEPLIFPIIQGMVAVMRKDFFMQLGGFDPGMKVWGTEQMELSVKVWLCGGRVELIPCSRVAHMFRITQWGGNINKTNHIAGNRIRFISVWMDNGEQKDIALKLQKDKGGIPSNIDARTAIREANNCKPYSYFLEQVKSVSDIYVLKNILAYGQIYSNMTGSCVDYNHDKDKLALYQCHGADNQYFLWTEKCQIRFEQHVIYVKPNSTELATKTTILEWDEPASVFLYKADNTILHVSSGLCVTIGSTSLKLQSCRGSVDQIFTWTRLRYSPCQNLK